MRRIVLGGLLSLALVTSSCKSDPSLPETWDKRITNAKSAKDKVKQVEALRESKFMTPAMVPMLEKHLGSEAKPEVKGAIARVLGEQKQASSVGPLSDAIDPAASDSDAKAMNKEIAVALGSIGDAKAVPALSKLLKSKDNYTLLAAIDGLGALKSKESFDPLLAIASDDTLDKFITKKAIIALGEIGDPRAVPTLIKAMFKERSGASFYGEASFALYQIGQPSADALLPVVEQKDKELIDWAAKSNVKDFALVAKALQVSGDLHDKRAEKVAVDLLTFKNDDPGVQLILRMKAADALGRMRGTAGVKPLAALLDETESNARREYVWGLIRIGSRDAVARLTETAQKGPWRARRESMRGVAMLGEDPAVFEKFAANEEKLFVAECKEDDSPEDCKDPVAGAKEHLTAIASDKLRAVAGAECKSDAACWVKKLDDKDAGVRERAAYEVGRSGNGALLPELMKRMPEENLDTRLALIQGADWLIDDSKDAAQKAKEALPTLQKQIADEKGKTQYVKVNEDLRRLEAKIQRS